MRPQLLGSLFAGLMMAAVGVVWHEAVQAGEGKFSAKKVKASATASKPGADGKQTVNVTLDIEKEWYIYANPVGADGYELNRTLLVVKAKDLVRTDIDYPLGKAKPMDGVTFSTYQNRVTIPVRVQRTAGDTSPLQIKIEVSACHPGKGPKNDGALCLPKGTIDLIVP